jgi:hypothetical protein
VKMEKADNSYNIYCDESCHLENDHVSTMVLGAGWCKKNDLLRITSEIKLIKKKYNLSPNFEIKWTKVSPAKKEFYSTLINYFFDESKLHFRSIIIPDKSKLDHEKFNQSHNDWYYKMYFLLLKEILDPTANYNIYIDIKDTRGYAKVKKLQDILCNNVYDFDKTIIKKIQQIHSNEAVIMQLADLFIGAITHFYRKLSSSSTKKELIDLIIKRSGHNLIRNTLPKEDKFNIFIWSPKEW